MKVHYGHLITHGSNPQKILFKKPSINQAMTHLHPGSSCSFCCARGVGLSVDAVAGVDPEEVPDAAGVDAAGVDAAGADAAGVGALGALGSKSPCKSSSLRSMGHG